jgi:hypothetical protein
MATNRVTPVQLLRSEVLNKRPDPAKLLPGQAGVNTNSAQPGLFFADNTGASLFKVGPCAVGSTAPNSGVDFTLGELWLDMSSTFDSPGPKLKVWDGSQWINCMPYTYANTIVSDTEPNVNLHPDGTLWWNSGTGLMYVLYGDVDSRQWTQISSNTVS